METMNKKNQRWNEFVERLGGQEGCNFRKENGKIVWSCGNSPERPFARKILEDMGNIDVDKSMDYFKKEGGYCDCEILFNVAT